MIGKTISHYKIIEKLGGGGMGVVYKAQDLKLDRFVALKFLPPELTRDEESKQRFIHEAKAASALEHTNICNIHEIDETDDGQIYIVMSSYEGETLKKKIERGPLKIDDAIDIIIQISEGLSRAHEKEIIHRDIKPANIFITEKGVVKILDFGLAKVSGQTQLTQMGTTVGTVAYISPEQARGEKVDYRTDIWSLGVVLYEMLTGQLPFKGDYEQAVMYSIMNEQPEPMTGLRTGVPMELERITNKTLAKSPDERYQHVDEIEADLKILKKELETPGKVQPLKVVVEESRKKRFPKEPEKKPVWHLPAYALAVLTIVVLGVIFYSKIFKDSSIPVEDQVNLKSVAVLPFTTITRAEEDEIFSAGIYDDILTQLAKIRDLKVISRTSVVRYKDTQKSMREIADELNVANILEGSVRRVGNRIRVVAQLIKADTDEHLWAETYDRDYTDIFAIQSDIAKKIALALKGTLTPEEKSYIEEIPTANMDAYDYFLKGNYYWYTKTTKESFLKAVEMYEKAIELDPDFALAYARVSVVHITLYNILSWDHTKERRQQAKTTLERAMQLDPDHPEVHFAAGEYYHRIIRDYDRALNEYEVAFQGHPNDGEIAGELGDIYRHLGIWDKAEEYLLKAYELSPQGLYVAFDVAQYYHYQRKWQSAERYYNKAINADPEQEYNYGWKALNYLFGYGDMDKAKTTLEEGMKNVDPSLLARYRFWAEIYSRRYEQALKIVSSDPVPRDRSLFKGIAYYFLKKDSSAKVEFDSARVIYEQIPKDDHPSNATIQGSLGIVYAGLGMKETAIREGKKDVELLPVKKDAKLGPWRLWDLAKIHLMIGEYDLAIDEIEYLLSIPSPVSKWVLKLDPLLDPVRSNPRFQKLINKKG
ncbi:MAG: hypothetical protein BMS9Abin02_2126 [Anaerolineae bacterium]|nr:MAG: hypothetical protein BMS9Abin02_2126 [Anaerolineae bacterium]